MKPFALLLTVLLALPAMGQTRYAVVIGGLGGSTAHTETFNGYLLGTHQALTGPLGFDAAHVTVLAEPSAQTLGFVDGVSLAEDIRAHFATLATTVRPEDEVYVFLFGHGSFDGTSARLNIPRRDLAAEDYDALLNELAATRIVFVNTTSASAPFIDALSAPGRVILTATRAGTQRNETRFPHYFVEALASPSADLDKNGDRSVLEAFTYAAEQTERHYTDGGYLATEMALIDDNGDAEGTRADALGSDLNTGLDGEVAAVTYLYRGASALAAGGPDAQEKAELERAIAELKSQKTRLATDDYYAQLETLFVRLARLNEALDMP